MLESSFVRPRQARYQAALRPDSKCFTHSKALSNFTPNPNRRFWPHSAKSVPNIFLQMVVPGIEGQFTNFFSLKSAIPKPSYTVVEVCQYFRVIPLGT